MKNLEKDLNDNLHILYGDPDMKKVFLEGTISTGKPSYLLLYTV